MEMWRGAIASQITSVFPCRSDKGEGDRRGRRKWREEEVRKMQKIKKEKGKELDSPPARFWEIFSSGKFPADETAVEMKTPQRLVDVTVIDS